MSRRLLPLIAPLAVILHSHLAAQDVEMLAREYGTTVPAAYYAELQRNPDAYRFGMRLALRGPSRCARPPPHRELPRRGYPRPS